MEFSFSVDELCMKQNYVVIFQILHSLVSHHVWSLRFIIEDFVVYSQREIKQFYLNLPIMKAKKQQSNGPNLDPYLWRLYCAGIKGRVVPIS